MRHCSRGTGSRSFRASLAAALLLALCAAAGAAGLPDGFSRIGGIAPTIRQDMLYAGSDNFVGRPLKGYLAPVCILQTDAAKALARVQQALAKDGLGLVVFDCYRPKSAVADMLAWARSRRGPKRGPHFPHVDRRQLIAQGYIASRSMHSTGYAVDLGLARLGEAASPSVAGVACTAPVAERGSAGTLDFGTSFDCFDPQAWTRSTAIPAEAAANRRKLVDAMLAQGFTNYSREWWHFSYFPRGVADPQDFPVTAAP